MIGNTGVHDQKSEAFTAQFLSDHCLLGTVSLQVVLASCAAVFSLQGVAILNQQLFVCQINNIPNL
jgi:hypothetical protein